MLWNSSFSCNYSPFSYLRIHVFVAVVVSWKLLVLPLRGRHWLYVRSDARCARVAAAHQRAARWRGSPATVLPAHFQFMTLFCGLFHLERKQRHGPPADTLFRAGDSAGIPGGGLINGFFRVGRVVDLCIEHHFANFSASGFSTRQCRRILMSAAVKT